MATRVLTIEIQCSNWSSSSASGMDSGKEPLGRHKREVGCWTFSSHLASKLPGQFDQLSYPMVRKDRNEGDISCKAYADLGNQVRPRSAAYSPWLQTNQRDAHCCGRQSRVHNLAEVFRHRESHYAPEDCQIDSVENNLCRC